jgi:hypothetical protein
MPQNLRSYAIIALIHAKAQFQISFHRIITLLLKFVGLELVHQAYSPAFLVHIQYQSLSLLFDSAHGQVELVAAVASQ